MKVYIFKANNYYIGENLNDELKALAEVVEVDEIPEGETLKITRDENNKPVVNFIDGTEEFELEES